MNYWHEPRAKYPTVLVRNNEDGQISYCIRKPNKLLSIIDYQVFISKWIATGPPQLKIMYPQGWIELWPIPSISTNTWIEANNFVNQLMQTYQDMVDETQFTVKYSDLEFVESIELEKGIGMARIYHHRNGKYNGKYEVKYFACTQGRGGGWVSERFETCTFADNLENARQAAEAELQEIVMNTDQ